MLAIKVPLSVYDQSDQSVGEGANKTKDMKTHTFWASKSVMEKQSQMAD